MKSPNEHLPLAIPESVAVCPICSAPLVIDEIQDWGELGGKILIYAETSVKFDCTTEPDIDDEEWAEWHRGHWSTPYIDWLPLESKVRNWLMYNAPTNWNEVTI